MRSQLASECLSTKVSSRAIEGSGRTSSSLMSASRSGIGSVESSRRASQDRWGAVFRGSRMMDVARHPYTHGSRADRTALRRSAPRPAAH